MLTQACSRRTRQRLENGLPQASHGDFASPSKRQKIEHQRRNPASKSGRRRLSGGALKEHYQCRAFGSQHQHGKLQARLQYSYPAAVGCGRGLRDAGDRSQASVRLNERCAESGIELDGQRLKVEFFLAADYKFLAMVLGHKGARALFNCLWCLANRNEEANVGEGEGSALILPFVTQARHLTVL